MHSKSSPGMWRPADEVCLCWGIAGDCFEEVLIFFQATVGQQLVQAPELQLARGPALAGFASLFVQGWQKSPWGGRAKQQKFVQWSGPQGLVVMEVLDTGILRGPQLLACPNPCCDLHNLHILKSCIVYF